MFKRLMFSLGYQPVLSTEDDHLLFGAQLRKARTTAGMTQPEAAKACRVRVNKLSAIENGEAGAETPTPDQRAVMLASLTKEPKQHSLLDAAG